jgi:tetratricopeptide (TPR) repeat protein
VPHIVRGLILDHLGLLDPAIDALEVAVALAPEAKEPIAILAGVLSRTALSHQAEAALRKALTLDPRNPQLMNDHAAILMRLHRHAEASALLREVLHSNGPHASVICNLANATVCLGEQDQAVELAHAAIALEPEAVLPRRALANTLPYQDGVTGAALLRVGRDCADVLPRGSLPALTRTSRPGPAADGRASVRYVAYASGRMAYRRGARTPRSGCVSRHLSVPRAAASRSDRHAISHSVAVVGECRVVGR